MMTFSDWPAMATATQTKMSINTVASTLFYFTPKSTWILAYQWGSAKFNYMTSTDPTKASSWSGSKALLTEDPTGGSSTGPIDQTVICDNTNCHLFFCGDNSNVYRASMPIGNSPGTFSGAKSIINDADAFEAVQVHTVKGTGQYLMIVETNGSPRSFVAYSASSLGALSQKCQGLLRERATSPSPVPPGRATSVTGIWFAPIPTKPRPLIPVIYSSSIKDETPT